MTTNVTPFPILIPDGHRGERGLSSPKANSHPYAIKTTSTALLSRSNSSNHSSYSTHYYVPPSPKQSGDMRHRYTRSETSLHTTSPRPRPLPVPPISKDYSSDATSPSPHSRYSSAVRANQLRSVSPVKVDNLPMDPRTWTPGELSSYLVSALPVARPVACDIAGFIRNCRMTGRTFLRVNQSDLNVLNLNESWCRLLLDASAVLRQNTLKGRIWGFNEEFGQGLYGNKSHSDTSSPFADSPLISEGAFGNNVTSFQRPRSRSISSGSEVDSVDVFGSNTVPDRHSRRKTIRPFHTEEDSDYSASSDSSLPVEPFSPPTSAISDEPTIEELLASSGSSNDLASSWGTKAWETLDTEIDSKVTMKRAGAQKSALVLFKSSKDNNGLESYVDLASQLLPSPRTDFFASNGSPKTECCCGQDSVGSEAQLLEAKSLAQVLRDRLEDAEQKLAELEKSVGPQDATQTDPDSALDSVSESSKKILALYKDTHADRNLTNTSDWDLLGDGTSSYILMAGLGICTVVVQSMLQRWAYRKS